jgi:hypothetical protein
MVPCRFQHEAKNLGFLQSLEAASRTQGASGPGKFGKSNMPHVKADIPAGTKVTLPFWLSSSLAQRDICEIEKPEYLTPQFTNIMAAGADVVNFRR